MTMQFAPFGLQISDVNWLTATGDRAPSLRCVAASDQNAFAVGDVVKETGASIGGIAVVSSALVQVGPGGTSYTPVGGSTSRPSAQPLIVVAVAPSTPDAPGPSPVLPGGAKGSTGMVWVIPAGSSEFFVAGDASTPARGETLGPAEAPLNLSAQNINDGTLFARLRYGAPAAGVSGATLDGSSFTDGSNTGAQIPGGHGELVVLGLASGTQLGPHALYRVRFRGMN